MSTSLRKFSDEALLEELSRRQRIRLHRESVLPFKGCEDCANFVPWTTIATEMPDKYNPCSKGHRMNFRMPEHVSDYDFGFYRRCCGDRADRPAERTGG